MAPNIQVYNSAGSTIITAISFTGHSPGTASAAQTFRFVNDDSGGAVDTATDPAIIIRAQDGVGALVTSGVRALDERWLEAKLTGNGTASGIVATGWVPIGRDRWFLFPEMESGEYVEFQLRENRPGSGGSGEVVYDLQGEAGQLSQSLDPGRSETFRDGVLTGLGDGTWGEIIYIGGDVEEAGTPDATVVLPDLAWRNAGGEPRVKLTHSVALNGNDGSAVALASGEAYYAVLSLAAAGTITVTKGDKAATPLDPDVDAPAVPEGEILLARVERQFDAIINTADIANLYTLGAFQIVTSAASLNVTLGAGRAMVDNRLIRRTAETVLGLSASETSTIWLLPSGSFSVTEDASRPESGALLMYTAVTDGSGVTGTPVDYREWVGGEVHLLLFPFLGTVVAAEFRYGAWPFERDGFIWPLRGPVLSVGSNGIGNAAGSLVADVFATDGVGGAFTTIYTSNGTDDRRALVTFDATEPCARSGLPEVLKIVRGARTAARTVFPIAYDVDDPEDASVVLAVYLV